MARKVHGQSYGYGRSPESLLDDQLSRRPSRRRWPSEIMQDHDKPKHLDGILLNGELVDTDFDQDDVDNAKYDAMFKDITTQPDMETFEDRVDRAYGIGKFAVARGEKEPSGPVSYRNLGRKSKITS